MQQLESARSRRPVWGQAPTRNMVRNIAMCGELCFMVSFSKSCIKHDRPNNDLSLRINMPLRALFL